MSASSSPMLCIASRSARGLLAELVQEKTGGNPFFAIQFFTALAEEGLLAFDPVTRSLAMGHRSYPRQALHRQRGGSHGREGVGCLPAGALQIMKRLACLGNSTETSALGMVVGQAEEEIHAVLTLEGVRTGLIFRLDRGYAFAHDRVREAAYALISEDERAASHLHIGRVLASGTPSEELEEKIFEIVNQFDRATALIATAEEREQVAKLDLIAGEARQILHGLCVGTAPISPPAARYSRRTAGSGGTISPSPSRFNAPNASS